MKTQVNLGLVYGRRMVLLMRCSSPVEPLETTGGRFAGHSGSAGGGLAG
jgi:hypothetical protein